MKSKITPQRLSILAMIEAGYGIRKIARSLNISHPGVLKHVRILEKEGYISRLYRSSKVQYAILQAGSQALLSNEEKRLPPPEDSFLTGGSKRLPPPENDKVIRLHRLQIKFDLKTPVSDPSIIKFRDHPSKIVPLTHWMKNIIEFEDFSAIITTKSMIISGIQRYISTSKDIESQEALILEQVIPFAEQVEEKIRRMYPKFQLRRLDRGVLAGKIIGLELAWEHHPIAESAKRMEIKDPEDGKPRIIVDKSKGFPELETVHKAHASEDMEYLRKNTWALSQVDLQTTFHTIKELTNQAYLTQDQISQVIGALGKISAILGGST